MDNINVAEVSKLDFPVELAKKIVGRLKHWLLISLLLQLLAIVALYYPLFWAPNLQLSQYLFSALILLSLSVFKGRRLLREDTGREILKRWFDLPLIVALSAFLSILSRGLFPPEVGGFQPGWGFYYFGGGIIILGSLIAQGRVFHSTPRMGAFFIFSLYGALTGNFESLLLLTFSLFTALSGLGVLYVGGERLPLSRIKSRVKSLPIPSIKRRGGRKGEKNFSFVVQIVDEEDFPVQGLKVGLFNREMGFKEYKTTDSEGKASFGELQGGEYVISVEGEGIEPQYHNRHIIFSTGEVIRVEREEEASVDKDIFRGESALIEYTPSEDLSKVVKAIVREHLAHGREVFLASMPPRSYYYQKRFTSREGGVRVVNVPLRGKPPRSDRNIQEIPMSNLEYFRAVFEEMPAGSLFIFEPLSTLILNQGRNPAYKFIASGVEALGREGMYFISFVNTEDVKETSMFRELFAVVARISEGRLEMVK